MIKGRTALQKWILLLPLLLFPGCSKTDEEKKMTLTINGHEFRAEFIRKPGALKKFLSWNILSKESAFVVRHSPPRYHFYDAHQNAFDLLFLDPEGRILEIARLEASHDGAVTSKEEAEWAVFLLPGTAEERGIREGKTVSFSEALRGERPELLATISINEHPLRAEVAATPTERQHGLMHRKKMSADDAMIFLHEGDSPEYYWMKNVHIGLDIAFFRADGTLINVVEMKKYPDPGVDSGARATPLEPARYVVETNLGWFRAKELSEGKGIRLFLPDTLE